MGLCESCKHAHWDEEEPGLTYFDYCDKEEEVSEEVANLYCNAQPIDDCELYEEYVYIPDEKPYDKYEDNPRFRFMFEDL